MRLESGDVLERPVLAVAGHVVRVQLPTETSAPQQVECGLVLLHFGGRDQDGKDDAGTSTIDHVVVVITQVQGATAIAHQRGIRVGDAGTVVSDAPIVPTTDLERTTIPSLYCPSRRAVRTYRNTTARSDYAGSAGTSQALQGSRSGTASTESDGVIVRREMTSGAAPNNTWWTIEPPPTGSGGQTRPPGGFVKINPRQVVVTTGMASAGLGILAFATLSTQSHYWPDVIWRQALMAAVPQPSRTNKAWLRHAAGAKPSPI